MHNLARRGLSFPEDNSVYICLFFRPFRSVLGVFHFVALQALLSGSVTPDDPIKNALDKGVREVSKITLGTCEDITRLSYRSQYLGQFFHSYK